ARTPRPPPPAPRRPRRLKERARLLKACTAEPIGRSGRLLPYNTPLSQAARQFKCLAEKLFSAQTGHLSPNLPPGVFASRNERLIGGYGRAVRAARELEPQIKSLSDEALRAK